MRKVFILIICGLIFSTSSFAQKTEVIKEPHRIYEDATNLFAEEKFGAAYQRFNDYIAIINDENSYELANAYFYKAISATMLVNNDADKLILDFIKRYPDNSKVNKAYFYLAGFYQGQSEFQKSIYYFNQIDAGNLTKDEKYELYYKLGYCYFMADDYANAKINFKNVKDSKSKYSSAATYYMGHILYNEKKYDNALKEFNELRKDRNFGGIVPTYIGQIYYLQSKYKELIKMASELSSYSSSKRSGELNRMLGEAYCKLDRYEEAIPYLEKGVKDNTDATAQDNYLLGYTLCKNKRYSDAIPYLLKCSEEKDSLSQNALYHLGYCYLNTGEKENARSRFLEAYNLDFDSSIREDALLNYAKLSYDSPNPYNEAIKSFQTFLTDYPKSRKTNEVKGYLAQLYGASKNYQDAIKMLDGISNRNKALNEAYQRIALNRGIEVMNENKFREAVSLFNKSIEFPFDNQLTAAAYFLRGECMYRLGNFDGAVKNLNSFYSLPQVEKSIYFPKADYSMAYNYFKQKKYSLAKDYFARFLKNSKNEHIKIIADANNRLGDCYFMAKDWTSASKQYDKVIEINVIDIDYATYQKAVCIGASGNTETKANILQKALNDYPESTYKPSMLFELANCYLIMDESEQALKYYTNVAENYPQSIHARACLGKIGLINYKLGKDDEALKVLDNLVKSYPATEEAKAGLMNIRTIYVDKNKVDDYYTYVKTIPSADFSSTEQDSVTYEAAENVYMNGDWETSISGLSDYLKKFPNGFFSVNANYYLGDCLNKKGDLEGALECYIYICDKPKNKFTEKSILNAANLSYTLKNYKQASELYSRLENEGELNTHISLAQLGKMRSFFNASIFDTAIICAKTVLKNKKNTSEIIDEANYIVAKSSLMLGDTKTATVEFNKLKKSKNGEYAGEANYFAAETAFKEKDFKGSERIIHSISANPTSEYWLAKSFILWADIFTEKKQYLQAKQTLQSIIENYDGDDLITIAQERLEGIEKIEEDNKLINTTKPKKEKIDEVIIDNKKSEIIESTPSEL